MQNPRVALCLSGHLRNWERCFPSIKAKFLDRYKPDVFVSTWMTAGYWSWENSLGINDLNQKVDIGRFIDSYKPKSVNIETLTTDRQDDFESLAQTILIKDGESRLRYGRVANIAGMFYKIGDCMRLKNLYEMSQGFRYDIVIRLRPDLEIFDISDPVISPSIVNVAINTGYWEDTTPIPLIDDKIFMGSGQAMDKICSLYDNLENIYIKKKCKFDPHSLLEAALDYFGLKANTITKRDYTWNNIKGYCTPG